MPDLLEIRPEVAIYAAFARLNYKPWYALAEFVDNSVQSYLSNRDRLFQLHGSSFKLRIEIHLEGERIRVVDNAAGIAVADFPRAFLPASPPPDTSGLSEFGLGLKAAACWFAKKWSVSTVAIGDAVRRSVEFDIPQIVGTKSETVEVQVAPAREAEHGTTIELRELNVRMHTRTISKVKEHLASIYRGYLREGSIELWVDGDVLSWTPPRFLSAPYFTEPSGEIREWRRDFFLPLDETHSVRGWAGILSRASVANAGFAIFRRNRVIEGSSGEAYRPPQIFRGSNSYPYQRLVGEIEVEGFSVSHTKDGVQWADWEDDILEWLKRELESAPVPLLSQAEGYRARPSAEDGKAKAVEAAAIDAEQVIVQHVPPLLAAQVQSGPDQQRLPDELSPALRATAREAEMTLTSLGETWRVRVELVSDEPQRDWLEIADDGSAGRPRHVHIRVNISHPFMVRHATPNGSELEALVRLAAGLALAEIAARSAGVRQAGTVRRNLNELLFGALSVPTLRSQD